MTLLEWILVVVVWHLLGCCIITVCYMFDTKIIHNARGLEIVNPEYIWKQTYLNAFGCCVVALFFAVLVPIPTAGYWFYKLCTVGRK
jgi:hypothetical protein